MAAALPLAAGLDWLEGILPLLFLLVWIVTQVRNLFRGGDRGQPAGPVVVRQPRPVRPPPRIDDMREDLARQIEEFVRRSSGEGAAAPPAGRPRDRGDRPAPRGASAPPPRGTPPPARRQRPVASGTRPQRTAPAPAAAPPSLGSLGGHATDVSRHVHDAFAHEIEHLPQGLAGGGAPAATATPARSPAADVVAALRDPVTRRQLVIVREVLDRPLDRW